MALTSLTDSAPVAFPLIFPTNAAFELVRLVASSAPAAFAERDVETGGDDNRGADPGRKVRQIPENQVAEDCGADQFGIAERRQHRDWAVLEGTDQQ